MYYMASNHQVLTRTALLLTLTLIFQSLRLFIPLPPIISVFFIGSLVNACLLIAVDCAGVKSATIIAILAPIIAYFQQMLFMPIFIMPIAIGNILYVLIFTLKSKWGYGLAVSMAAVIKTSFLYVSFLWLVSFIAMPSSVITGIVFIMSWPQLVTAGLGGFIAFTIIKRIKCE